MGEIIPTSGNYFNFLTEKEEEPHIISLSTGRLGVVLERIYVGTGTPRIHYLYTPTDRSEWTEVLISPHSYYDPCICELANGNVGVVVKCNNDLYYKIITPTGATVTDWTLLYDPGTNWVANPYVIKLANDSYLLVYPEGTGTPPSESNTYSLQMRTSSNFTSWSASTDITPAAFASVRYCNNPHLLQVTSGRIFLHVDYLNSYVNLTELNNIYHMTSDDNGATWSVATKVTDFTDLGQTATHPTATEKSTGDITFMYAQKSTVKTLDVDMTGYPYGLLIGGIITFDETTKEIHWSHTIYSGGPPRWGITTIDTQSWSWVKTITEETIPAIQAEIVEVYPSDCEWTCSLVNIPGTIQAYNHTNDSSKLYKWGFPTSGSKTYVLDMQAACGFASLSQVSACVATHNGIQKLIIFHVCNGYGSNAFSAGWIDLNENADAITGLYTYHEVYNSIPGTNVSGGVLDQENIRWDYEHDCVMSMVYGTVSYWPGIWVLNPQTGNVYLELNYTIHFGFPRYGARDAVFVGDDLYFSFPYCSAQPDRRGLGHYSAATGTISYHEPTWATANEYNLDNFVSMGDGRILMNSNNTLGDGGGIVVYDTNTGVWMVFNDDTYPGFGHTGNYWGDLCYDPATKTIYARYANSIVAFSEYGPYSTLLSNEIENVDSTIDYGEYFTFSYYNFEYQPNIVFDSDGVLWAVWQHVQDGTESSAKWANLLDDVEFTDDITGAISITWDVERIAQLQFSIAHGHLYDPQNLMSTMAPFLRKGRKILIKLGETVSSTDYFQEQGEFCITSVALEYATGKYPTVNVRAEDNRTLWEFNEVVATTYYENQSPYNVLESVLLNHGNMSAGELDIPETWENEHNLYHQFVDMTLDDIVQTLMDHFGYFPYVNVDGKFEPRYINLSKATDHIYSDNTKIIKYTPDDKYSSFINRVIVKGISHAYFEVLYEEEVITSLRGTTGWWGKDVNETAWYSDDHNRTCRYPRLEILQSVTEFHIFGIKGGGDEQITDTDEDEQYVIVTIESPNLVGVLIAAIASCVSIISACTGSCDGGPHKTGWCSWCNYGMVMSLNVALMILGAIASYSYNIWARPIGHEKRTFQATADDDELQAEMGNKIVSATIDDPMCYTISSCQTVADHELAVIMAQRRRLKFCKTSHLQDEIGDVVEFVHPYSGETLKNFIAKLKRTWVIGGDCTDEIEGWRIMS
ncbi:MAG: hypothetical protein JRE58_02365 [Deltaproteobacteria bacterium]|nr:hypothetical protein [Deltaproteobacteria bacterium]